MLTLLLIDWSWNQNFRKIVSPLFFKSAYITNELQTRLWADDGMVSSSCTRFVSTCHVLLYWSGDLSAVSVNLVPLEWPKPVDYIVERFLASIGWWMGWVFCSCGGEYQSGKNRCVDRCGESGGGGILRVKNVNVME